MAFFNLLLFLDNRIEVRQSPASRTLTLDSLVQEVTQIYVSQMPVAIFVFSKPDEVEKWLQTFSFCKNWQSPKSKLNWFLFFRGTILPKRWEMKLKWHDGFGNSTQRTVMRIHKKLRLLVLYVIGPFLAQRWGEAYIWWQIRIPHLKNYLHLIYFFKCFH